MGSFIRFDEVIDYHNSSKFNNSAIYSSHLKRTKPTCSGPIKATASLISLVYCWLAAFWEAKAAPFIGRRPIISRAFVAPLGLPVIFLKMKLLAFFNKMVFIVIQGHPTFPLTFLLCWGHLQVNFKHIFSGNQPV